MWQSARADSRLAGAPLVAFLRATLRDHDGIGTSFLFTGLAARHRAILLRDMRIRMVALIDVVSLVGSIVAALDSPRRLGCGPWWRTWYAARRRRNRSWLAAPWIPDGARGPECDA